MYVIGKNSFLQNWQGDINEKPKAGSDVKFKWNHGGESEITMVFKNLLEE